MRTAGANEAPTGRPAKNQNGGPDLWQAEEGAGTLGAGCPRPGTKHRLPVTACEQDLTQPCHNGPRKGSPQMEVSPVSDIFSVIYGLIQTLGEWD